MATFDVIRLAPCTAAHDCRVYGLVRNARTLVHPSVNRFTATNGSKLAKWRGTLERRAESEEWVDLTEPDKIDQLRVDIRKLYLKMT